MLTFNEFAKNEYHSPKLAQSPKQQLSRANVFREQVGKSGQRTPAEIVTSVSQEITDLNRTILTDRGCAPVVKMLSEMIFRLHFLLLAIIEEGGNNG